MSQRTKKRAEPRDERTSSPVTRRSTLGWPGFLFVGLTVFLAVGAVNSQNNLLFWVFGVAVAGVIVSGVISGSGLMGVRLQAHKLQTIEAGAPASIAYTISNVNRWFVVFAIEIREVAGSTETFRETAAGVMHLAPQSSERAIMRFEPQRRGVLELDRVVAESRFPFGLLVKTLEFSVPRKTLVLPARLQLRPAIFDSGSAGGMGDGSRRARTGAGADFYSVREYTPGDPRRAIAWRPSAKRGELLVIERNEPRDRSVWIWVSRPKPSIENGDILGERALALALGLVRQGIGRGRSVGVWIPWAGVRIEPGTGRAFETRIAEVLGAMELAASAGSDADADAPPPGQSGADVLLIPLGRVAPADDVSSAGSRFDPATPADWLAGGAELPEHLADQGAKI